MMPSPLYRWWLRLRLRRTDRRLVEVSRLLTCIEDSLQTERRILRSRLDALASELARLDRLEGLRR